MNSTLSWSEEMAGSVANDRNLVIRRAMAISALIVVAAACLSAWVYTLGEQSLPKDRAQVGSGALPVKVSHFRPVDRVGLSLIALALVGGAGCMAPLLVAAMSWRRQAIRHLQRKAEDWQVTAGGLQSQVAEARRAKEASLACQVELEQRLTALTATNARLEEEVGKRNQAEKALTQRRQQLESSKSVLEVHVQARTQELHQLQRRYEMILNSAGEGICGLDLEGKATFVNPTVAKLTGWPLAELIGKTEKEIFFGQGQPTQAGPGSSAQDQQVFYRKDGTPFPVEFVRTPINEDGRLIGSVLVFKDITERKRADETLAQRAAELARSNSELEQFAFVASHDLQEPLRKIQAFGDRLKTKCEAIESPDILDYLARMQSAATRMRTLINDLLAFSRVIRSSEPFAPVDLAQVTREVLGDLEVRIEKTNAKVEVAELPTIDADAMQMRQLMLNLISNALKFQPPGGTPAVKITSRLLSALSGEQLCEIHVQDNGIGFDERYLDKIFAVFQRLHGRGEYEGTGVGLAVCRRIVDRHHGSIIGKSQPGQGATFIVTLPVRPVQPKAVG